MEPIQILEKLYEEAKKRYYEIKREISREDLELNNDWSYCDRDSGRIKLMKIDSPLGRACEVRYRPLTVSELNQSGFSSENPPLSEFLKKHGLEKEISTFMGLYTSKLNAISTKEVKRSREQGILDAEASARARNRSSQMYIDVGDPRDDD